MYISIDLGGTNTRLAVSTNGSSIAKKVRFPTKKEYKEQIDAMRNEIDNLSESKGIKALCIGVPGFVDYKANKIKKVINVPYLSEFNAEDLVSDGKVLVANDAALGGLGESLFGVAKEFETIAYITLSTGVGGIRIHNKKLNIGQKFSEPGHMIIHDTNKVSVLTNQPRCVGFFG